MQTTIAQHLRRCNPPTLARGGTEQSITANPTSPGMPIARAPEEVNMILERSCPIVLLVGLIGCWSARAQQHAEDLSVPERTYLASKIYSSIETYFAHWTSVPDLDFEAAYKTYLDKALQAKGRRGFDLATLELIAQLRNKHTQLQDQWLQQRHGQPLGFGVWPVEGK